MKSRALLVVGMHRSGTSAVARGLKALAVDLGNDFLDAQPENPTGYWEDRGVVNLNERVLKTLRLIWDDAAPVAPRQFRNLRIRLLRAEAARYLRRTFGSKAVWGFKDPRTVRLLPFWRDVLRGCNADDAYVIVIRNPRSVATSLHRRQAMSAASAHRLWLVHMVPFLRELRHKPLVVVDYDLLMEQPRAQLERIAEQLALPFDDTTKREADRFAADFLDEALRHTVFSPHEPAEPSEEGCLTQDAYALLHARAADASGCLDDPFWAAWERIERDADALLRT